MQLVLVARYHGSFNTDTIWIVYVGCDDVQFHWSPWKNNPTELDCRRSERLYEVLLKLIRVEVLINVHCMTFTPVASLGSCLTGCKLLKIAAQVDA